MKLASQASALECRGELGVCVMVFVVKAHDARLAQLIHNFLKYLFEWAGLLHEFYKKNKSTG
jgi:hypothetical protein